MFNLVMKNSKKILVSFLTIMAVFLGLTYVIRKDKVSLTERQKRLKLYDQVQAGDEAVSGTTNIDFDAFFLEDIDGDNHADKIRGNAIEIGDTKKLYIDIKVHGDAKLINGQLKFVNSNSRLSGAIAKSSFIPSNLNEYNYSSIKLSDSVDSGKTALLQLQVNSNLTNDLNSYTGINKVILTGTVVDLYGNKLADIEKEVSYTVDWYGDKLNTTLTGTGFGKTNGHSYALIDAIFTYNIKSTETKGQLFLKQAYLEAIIAPLNDGTKTYEPSSVKVQGTGIEYTYDPTTRKLTATKKATLNDTLITTQAYNYKYEDSRINEWKVIVEYDNIDNHDSFYTNISATSWYDAFNNPGVKESNKASHVISATIRTDWDLAAGHRSTDFVSDSVVVGTSSNALGVNYVEKMAALNIYNGADVEESKTPYNVKWTLNAPTDLLKENNGGNTYTMKVTDLGGDKLDDDTNLKNYITYKTIKINSLDGLLNTTGYVAMYNADNDELIHVFTALDWNSPYTFADDVNSIYIVLNGFKAYTSYKTFTVDIVKEIDNVLLANNLPYQKFATNLTIKSSINASTYKDGNPFNITYWASYHNTNNATTHGSASYLDNTSNAYISSNKMSISTTEESEIKYSISTNIVDEIAKGFKDGEFLLVFPEDALDVKLENVDTNDTELTFKTKEVGTLANGRKYIKIITSNPDAKKISFDVLVKVVPDARKNGGTSSVELYAYNPECHNYTAGTKDIYDLNNNNDVTELVDIAKETLTFVAPNEIITTSVLKAYNQADNTTVAPMIAEVNPVEDDPEATVEIGITNNSEYSATNINIIGKVAYLDNTYQLGTGNLGSKYDVHMTNDGIRIPAELDGKVTVYYSEEETPTVDPTLTSNGWKLKDQADLSRVKSYLIVFDNNFTMPVGKDYQFTYDIEMPNTTANLNKVTYFTHAVYYDLNTDSGLYSTSVGGAKLGIRMSRQYDLELTDLKLYSTKTIAGAKYLLTDEDGNERIISTNANGISLVKDLYVGVEYTLKQISVPSPYLVDETTKTFKLVNNNDDSISLTNTGTYKSISLTNDKKVEASLENETRYDLVLTDKDLDTNENIIGAKFTVTGKGYESGKSVRIKSDGTVKLTNLYLNEEYTVEQADLPKHLKGDAFTLKLIRDTDGQIKTSIIRKPSFADDLAYGRNYNSYTKTETGFLFNANGKTDIYAEIPIDLTGLRKNYVATVFTDFSGYNNNSTYMNYVYLVEGECNNDESRTGIQTYWFNTSSSLNSTYTKNNANNLNSNGTAYVSGVITGGKKYCLKMKKSAYSGYYRLDLRSLLPQDGVDEEFMEANFVNLPTKENPNALRTLIDNNLDTPVLRVDVVNKKVPTYTLDITKVDAETNEPLAGAQYKIEGPGLPQGGKYLTTDASGKASIELIEKYELENPNTPWRINGTDYSYDAEYTLTEVAAPIGYTLDQNSITFTGKRTFTTDGYTYANNVYNYTIDFATNGKSHPMTYNLNTEGKFKSESWDEATNTHHVVLKDYPIVKITKKDSETGALLPNTLFAVYKVQSVNGTEVLTPAVDANGNIIGNKIIIDGTEYYASATDSNGNLTYNLGAGQYKVIEVQAADEKYELSSATYYFGIGETVPYHKTPAKVVDYIEINGFDVNNSSTGGGSYTKTSDGGFVVSTKDKHLIKYDKNLNVVWNVSTADIKYLNGRTEYYYNGALAAVRQESEYSDSDAGKVYEAPDGSIYLSKSSGFMTVAKFDKDGHLIWKNEEINHSVEEEFIGICNKAGNTNENGYVQIYNRNSTTGELEPTGSYWNISPGMYWSVYDIDENTYYCGSENETRYNDFSSTSVIKDVIYTDDGGIFLEVITSSLSSNGKLKLKSVTGEKFEITAQSYNPIFVKFDKFGHLKGAYNFIDTIKEAEAAYKTKYGLTTTTSNIEYGYYDRHFVGQYPNGDILIVGGTSKVFAAKLRYNATEDKFDVLTFTPIGINGWNLTYPGYDPNTYTDSIQLTDDGGFAITVDGSTYITDYHTKTNDDGSYAGDKYYDTELQQYDHYLQNIHENGDSSNVTPILKFDKNGKLENLYIAAVQTDRVIDDPSSVYYDYIKYFYVTYRNLYSELPNGNMLISSQGQQTTWYPERYMYLRMSNGELERIPDATELPYRIGELNKNTHQLEWFKFLTGIDSPGGSQVLMILGDGKKALIPIKTRASEIVDLVTGDTLQVTSGSSGFLVLELSDVIQPSGPEAYTLNITNDRKEYTIKATQTVGGEIEVINPANGQNVVVTNDANGTLLEKVKYGDTNKYTINIKPNNTYSVSSVKINGEDAKYTVNADGSITLNQIEDIKENKDITVTFVQGLAQVVVKHYLEGTTDSVFGDEILTGTDGTPYETEAKVDYLYSLATNGAGEVILPSNMTGNFDAANVQTVVFYYKENQVDLKVNYYLDGTETEVAPTKMERKLLGSRYQTAPMDIEFYQLTRTIGEESGTLKRATTEVTYMYQQNNEATITIRHVDKATNQDLVTPITKTVTRHTTYTTDDQVTIPANYRLISTPLNATGPAEDANIEVIYYYEVIPFNISTDKKIKTILINGEKEMIKDNKNVSITPNKKDNVIVYYEIEVKNDGEIPATYKVEEKEVDNFEIYDMGEFTKSGNSYIATGMLNPGESKVYKIGYKWNQTSYGISTNKVEIKDVANSLGFVEPDAADNKSEASVGLTVPKEVLGANVATIPNTIDKIKEYVILFIISIVGIAGISFIMKKRMN